MPFRHKGGVSPPSRLWRTEEATRSPCGEVAAKLCWLLPPGENSRWAFSGLSSADPTPAAGGALRPRTRVLSSCCRPRAFIYNRRFLRAAIRDAHSGTARGSRPRLQRGGPGPSGRPRVAAEAAPVGFLALSRGLAAPTPSGARAPRAAAVVASGGKLRSLYFGPKKPSAPLRFSQVPSGRLHSSVASSLHDARGRTRGCPPHPGLEVAAVPSPGPCVPCPVVNLCIIFRASRSVVT